MFYEDMDLCLRARAAGIPTVFEPAVRIRHLGGHSTRPVYDGDPHDLLAQRRREVVGANRGSAALALDDLAQALTFGTRAAGRLVLGRRRRPRACPAQRRLARTGTMTPCRSGSSRLQTVTPSSRWSTRAAICTGPWAYPPERADQFDELLSRCARDDFACFIVIDDDTGGIAGVFNISQIVRGSFQSAFLGYYGSARYAGKGMMRAGLRQVLDYAFGPLSLHRIEANIQPGNAASIALARGAGFRLEGYSPRYLLIGGQWRDHERYALTVDERNQNSPS